MSDFPGFEAVEYEEGATPLKLRFVVTQKRLTIGDLLMAESWTAQERVEFVARFLVNDAGLYASRCTMSKDGTLNFPGIEAAVAILKRLPPNDFSAAVDQVMEAITGITESAVPLATNGG